VFGCIGALRGGISQKPYVSIEMQKDRMGLRHIGDVQGGAGHEEIEVGCGDGREVIRERDAGVVDRRAGLERNAHGMQSNRVLNTLVRSQMGWGVQGSSRAVVTVEEQSGGA